MIHESILIPLFFLLGSFCLSIVDRSMNFLGRFELSKEIRKARKVFYFFHIIRKLFQKAGWTNHYFISSITKQILRVLYASTSVFYLLSLPSFAKSISFTNKHYALDLSSFFLLVSVVIGLAVIVDFIAFLLSVFKAKRTLLVIYPIAGLFLLLFCPLTFFLLKLQKLLSSKSKEDKSDPSHKEIKEKIVELVWEADNSENLDPQDKKLILSVASFKERIAREIMVPRIDVFSLDATLTVEEATKTFAEERYSRVPVYRDTVDNIIGVLLYKDLLNFYINTDDLTKDTLKRTTIEKFLKPIVYTPETKKISHLLQEFRAKQLHLAIVVDEYGGTEGIVTIEDILEELVGEIADEYDDKNEEILFSSHPEGGWIVDAKMNINDTEKELGIIIPKSPEYDTIGGYIFERAGAIPTKGWRIHHENFDLEILSSTDRSIDKIRIIPPPSEDL